MNNNISRCKESLKNERVAGIYQVCSTCTSTVFPPKLYVLIYYNLIEQVNGCSNNNVTDSMQTMPSISSIQWMLHADNFFPNVFNK